MNKKFVVRGRRMRLTSTAPENYGEEETYDSQEVAQRVADQLKATFPFEEFQVFEI